MGRVLIIGAGGVGTVVAHKVAQNADVFTDIMIASRTKEKCDKIVEAIGNPNIKTAKVDADNVDELVALFNNFKPEMVINFALPYQDLTIMEACLKAGVNYLDTANYEPKDEAHFEYSWQWAYHERFKEAGLTAILGCGFDPGVSGIYTAYAASHPGVYNLLDNGHYHPTEMVSDKISALLSFFDVLPLHVTRPMRWDSDHVVRLDDEIREIALEIVRNGALDRVLIGLDYFDASINRVAAWVIGTRNMQKALLNALLQPSASLKAMQDKGDFTRMLMQQEEMKTYPFGAVWEEYCRRQGVPADESWFAQVLRYEQEVLSKRS